MKNRILSLLVGLLIVSSAHAQSEYRYIALRFGFSNAFSGQPDMNTHKYVYAPGITTDDIQQMQLVPSASFLGYTPGFKGSILYHFDFKGDMMGVITGLEYDYTGISSKYETLTRGYTVTETHRIHMVGVPLAFKYGPDIWDTQRYVYAGFKFNYIVSMATNEKVSWSSEVGGSKLESQEYKKTNFNLFFGVNWKAANIQLDFYPSSFFDDKYLVVDPVTNLEYAKYEGQVGQFFKITASVNVPYGWLSEQNFWWRRFLRKVPFWK